MDDVMRRVVTLAMIRNTATEMQEAANVLQYHAQKVDANMAELYGLASALQAVAHEILSAAFPWIIDEGEAQS